MVNGAIQKMIKVNVLHGREISPLSSMANREVRFRQPGVFVRGKPLYPFLFIVIMDCFSRMLINAESEGLIRGFSSNRENRGISITHLQFADVTILFSSQDEVDLRYLLMVFKNFEYASGLNLNYSKSELLGVAMDDNTIIFMADIFGCKIGNWPSSYSGLPLNSKANSPGLWQPIVEKIE